MAFEETPCAKCQLTETSEHTIEFDEGIESKSLQAESDRLQRAAKGIGFSFDMEDTDEGMVPLSVMKEIVFQLLCMTPENRDVLCWRFAGIPYRDIAILQGVTVSAVEKRHWKTLKRWPALRAMFTEKAAKHGSRKSVVKSQKLVPRVNGRKRKGIRVAFEKKND